MKQLLLFLVFLTIGCSDSDMRPDILFNDNGVPEHFNLEAEEIPFVMDSILNPGRLVCLDGMLFINDMSAPGPFHVIDLRTQDYVGNFGAIGEGPGELLSPFFFSRSGPNELLVFDSNLRKAVIFPSNPTTKDYGYSEEYLLKGIKGPSDIAVVGENVYGINILKTDHRIFRYDSSGNYQGGMGRLPINESQQEFVMAMANYSSLRYHKGIFAMGYRISPFVHIYNSLTNKWIFVSGPDDFKAEYRIRPNPGSPFGYTDKTRSGYMDLQISDRFIYALYSGEMLYEDENSRYSSIYVFDHQGNPLKKFKLSEGILSFDVHKDRDIYGLQYGEEHRLLKFTIPDQS